MKLHLALAAVAATQILALGGVPTAGTGSAEPGARPGTRPSRGRGTGSGTGTGTGTTCDSVEDCEALAPAAAPAVVNDSTLLFWEAVTFKHCCPPYVTGSEVCQGAGAFPGCGERCSLAPSDSYLARKGPPEVSLWSSLWNAVAYEIHDLVDILEYQVEQRVETLHICNHTFSRSFVLQDIVNRSRKVLELSSIPQWVSIYII